MAGSSVLAVNAHQGRMTRMTLPNAAYRNIVLIANSFWFLMTYSILFLLGFIIKQDSRTTTKEKEISDSWESGRLQLDEEEEEEKEKFIEKEKEERDELDDGEETCSLSFKFEYQVSESDWSSLEESPWTPTKAVQISKKRFNMYMEDPQATKRKLQKPSSYLAERKLQEAEKNMKFLKNRRLQLLKPFDFTTDSDSEWNSGDDDYSVKDLVVDSDSDDLLSETEVSGYECESDSTVNEKATRRCRSELLIRVTKKVGQEVTKVYKDRYYSQGCETENLSSRFSEAEKDNETAVSKDEKHPDEEEEDITLLAENRVRSSCWSQDWTDNVAGEISDESKELTDLETRISTESSGNIMWQNPNDSSNDGARSDVLDFDPTDHLLMRFDAFSSTSVDEDSSKLMLESLSKKYVEICSKDVIDGEHSDGLEPLWEHQDLIEQLKMELRKVQALGLPTIMEESESPMIAMEDLKPWKIDEPFLQENPIDDLSKFYKSYRERMRKLDILNYQKMYGIGFLQLKDPLRSIGGQKSLLPHVSLIISQNLRISRRRKSSSSRIPEKFMKNLQADLEKVYVGQMCLTWEFLRWQFEQVRRLPESDPYCHNRQYNQVAGEFQQFQVIIQRFMENECFQGPRLPNYIKTRCVLRNLLQVPVIKEDCLEDKLEDKRNGKGEIGPEMLEDIMEESIRVFWEFVKSDRDDAPRILKTLMASQTALYDMADADLLLETQACLLKKEKKLKDIQRSGNCIVKKFKKQNDDPSNQDLFFSKVDLKLVSRVLRMSQITTDQLVWCRNKLSMIVFFGGRVCREPSFLLFPCSN